MKLGWFKQEGLAVEVVPLPGSTRCRAWSRWPSSARTASRPGSSTARHADLKGKTIGVTNMASAGVIVARAQVAAAGLDPDTDVDIVGAGEGAPPAADAQPRPQGRREAAGQRLPGAGGDDQESSPRADRHGARVRQGHEIAADAKADKYGR